MNLTNLTLSSGLILTSLTFAGCGLDSTLQDLRGLETVEKIERKPPPLKDPSLQDDRLEDKHTSFDPDLIDRRPLGEWQVNSSEAILGLNIPWIQPDQEPQLLQLWPSYRDLQKVQSQHFSGVVLLPSVNMLDGKAKQFDDGLFAAVEQSFILSQDDCFVSQYQLIQKWLEALPSNSDAAAYLIASLSLVNDNTQALESLPNRKAIQEWLDNFAQDELAQKPISFYTWNDTLRKCWRFGSFLQHKHRSKSDVAKQLASALQENPELKRNYEALLSVYGRLSNPAANPSLMTLCSEGHERGHSEVSIFPVATSRETELFSKLFSNGIPTGADLMSELVKRIRSGEVDLKPRSPDMESPSGWYDYQVYALETLLVAERGAENNKLLLSKTYKQRMLDAFKALITKRRETQARNLGKTIASAAAAEKPPEAIQPRLRVEPAPTFYLRTARSYRFLQDILCESSGWKCIATNPGLKADGRRALALELELDEMKNRFYGLYLISCEDIGLKPNLLQDEVLDASQCYAAANSWLTTIWSDSDFSTDTRVAIPIASDLGRNVTRLWVTLGVRLAKLDVRYAKPPKIRPVDSSESWQEPDRKTVKPIQYLIPIDEFTELEISGVRSISREELRSQIPEAATREEIISSLQKTFQ